MEYKNTGKSEITGNRDATYSLWHRKNLSRKHTNIDNDLFELSDQNVYTLYYNFDSEGDLIPKVTIETKGIIYDADDDKFILPDLSPFIIQIKALRGTAKASKTPAFMVFYYITEEHKHFTVIPLNNLAKTYIPIQKAITLSETGYANLLYKICGIDLTFTGDKKIPSIEKFKYNKFNLSLNLLP